MCTHDISYFAFMTGLGMAAIATSIVAAALIIATAIRGSKEEERGEG